MMLIFSYLTDGIDLTHACLVCKRWASIISSEIKLWLPAAKGLNRWTTLSPENDESLHQLRRLIKEENQCISHWQALKKTQEILPDGRNTVDIKLLAVGDHGVGKTALLIAIATGKFPEEYIPTVFDNYTVHRMVRSVPFAVTVWDFYGPVYDRLRPLSYVGTQALLMCFDFCQPATLEHIRDIWAPEIRHYRAEAPMILVGTKMDLLSGATSQSQSALATEGTRPVTEEEALAVAQEIGAACFIPCSARSLQNVEELLQEVINVAVKFNSHSLAPRPQSSSCLLS